MHSHTLLVGMKITFGNVYQNNIMTLSFDQAIPLTEISLKDKKKKKRKQNKKAECTGYSLYNYL